MRYSVKYLNQVGAVLVSLNRVQLLGLGYFLVQILAVIAMIHSNTGFGSANQCVAESANFQVIDLACAPFRLQTSFAPFKFSK